MLFEICKLEWRLSFWAKASIKFTLPLAGFFEQKFQSHIIFYFNLLIKEVLHPHVGLLDFSFIF